MKALLVVDVQNDFCPGGALAVPEGDRVVPVINRLTDRFEQVVFTQDWHPAGHSSFASSHHGHSPFEHIRLAYGEQTLWPDHCIQGSEGADFHSDLQTDQAWVIIRKGFRKEIDSYSAFFENDHQTRTGLKGYLNEMGVSSLYICGLATDFCVKWTAIDAVQEGFEVNLIEDAMAGIDLEGSLAKAWIEMKQAGCRTILSGELI